MTDTQQRQAAKAFAEYWKDKGYEKGESQPFWLSLLRDVFGIEHPKAYLVTIVSHGIKDPDIMSFFKDSLFTGAG